MHIYIGILYIHMSIYIYIHTNTNTMLVVLCHLCIDHLQWDRRQGQLPAPTTSQRYCLSITWGMCKNDMIKLFDINIMHWYIYIYMISIKYIYIYIMIYIYIHIYICIHMCYLERKNNSGNSFNSLQVVWCLSLCFICWHPFWQCRSYDDIRYYIYPPAKQLS